MRKRPNHFEPRKAKKLSGPSVVGKMKTVRIDARTEIQVSADIPDDQARERFFARINRTRPVEVRMEEKVKNLVDGTPDEISLEDVAVIADEEMIVEQD